MKLKNNHIFIMCSLAIVGGFLNGYTYIFRGKVFATMQTGNIILGTIKLLEGDLLIVIRYLIPIISFCLGIFLALNIINKYNDKYYKKILVLEILCLLLIMFIKGHQYDVLVSAIISFIAGIQLESFSNINDIKYASTMCTGNLRSLTGLIYKKEKGNNAIVYISVIMSFVLGVILAYYSIIILNDYSLFICIIILMNIYYYISKNY